MLKWFSVTKKAGYAAKLSQSVAIALMVGSLTACENPAERKNEVEQGFAPGITLDRSSAFLTADRRVVVAGESTLIRLILRDNKGNVYSTEKLKVVLSFTGGTSQGVFGPIERASDGSYFARLTGTVAGTPSTVSCLVDGNPVAVVAPVVQVIKGQESYVDSELTVSSPTVQAGESVQIIYRIMDSRGNRIETEGLNVSFALSGGTSVGTLSSPFDAGRGVYKARFQGLTAGTPLKVDVLVDGEIVPRSSNPTIQVVAALTSLANSTLTVSRAQIETGTRSVVTLTARDSFGNRLNQGGRNVEFYHSGGTSTGFFGVISDNNNGTYTSEFLGAGVGTPTTIYAKVDGQLITTALPTIEVTAGQVAPSNALIQRDDEQIVSGTSTVVRLTLRDLSGNVIDDASKIIVFSHVGGTSTGTFGAVSYQGSGVYTAQFTGVAAGTPTALSATINGSLASGTHPSIKVVPGALSLANTVIEADANEVLLNGVVQVRVRLRDVNNNSLDQSGLSVGFSYSGGTSAGTIGAVAYLGSGVYAAPLTGVTAGTPSLVGASIGGSQVTSTKPQVKVITSDISPVHSVATVGSTQIVSSESTTIIIIIKDGNGDPINVPGLDIGFAIDNSAPSASFGNVVYNPEDGSYQADVTGLGAGGPAPIYVTINGTRLGSTPPNLEVLPGPLNLAASSIEVSEDIVPAGNSIEVSFHPKDVNGNPISAPGLGVVFEFSGGTSEGTFGSVSPSGSSYVASFTGTKAGTRITIRARVDGTLATDSEQVEVVSGGFSLAHSTLEVSEPEVLSGENVDIIFTPRDADGNLANDSGLAVVFSYSGGSSTGYIGPVFYVSGVYKARFTGKIPGTAVNIAATVGGQAHVPSEVPAITVLPGELDLAQSEIVVDSDTIESGSSTEVLLTLRDHQGNLLGSAGEGKTVRFSFLGGGSTGDFGPVTDVGGGVYRTILTGVKVGTPSQVAALVDGVEFSGARPSVEVIPGVFDPLKSVLTVSGVSVRSGESVEAKLILRDYGGNIITTGSYDVLFSYDSDSGTSTGNFGSVAGNPASGYTSDFTGIKSGTAVAIRAEVNGAFATPSVIPVVEVLPGDISLPNSLLVSEKEELKIGETSEIRLHLRDAHDNEVGAVGSGRVVSFALSGGTSEGGFGDVQDLGNGSYLSIFTATSVGTVASVEALVDSSSFTGEKPSIRVIPSEPSFAESVITISPTTIASGEVATITLQLKDEHGNDLSEGGYAVTFSHSIGSVGTIGDVIDNGDGTYSASFTGVLAGGPSLISGTLDGEAITSAPASITVIPSTVVSPSLSIFEADPTHLQVGQSSTFTLTLKDRAGNLMGSGLSDISFVDVSGPGAGGGTLGSIVDNSDGTYSVVFTASGGGSLTFKAIYDEVEIDQRIEISIVSGVSLVVPIEMIDTAVANRNYYGHYYSRGSRDHDDDDDFDDDDDDGYRGCSYYGNYSSSAEVVAESATRLNTNDYDGSPQYFFEIIASNQTHYWGSEKDVWIVDSAGNSKGKISVGRWISQKRYRIPFTPNAGEDIYRIKLDSSHWFKKFIVHTARIIVKQTNATKSRLYIPLMGMGYKDHQYYLKRWIGHTTSPTWLQNHLNRYVLWQKNSKDYAHLAGAEPWRFDAILSSDAHFDDDHNYGDLDDNADDDDYDDDHHHDWITRGNINGGPATCSASLFNMTDSVRVTDSTVSTQSDDIVLLSNDFANNASGFDDGDVFAVKVHTDKGRCRIAKAGLWVKLDPLLQGEIYYRIEKGYDDLRNLRVTDASRVLLNIGDFSSSKVKVFFESTIKRASATHEFKLFPANHGQNDSGTSGASNKPAPGCGFSSPELTTEFKRYRSGQCQGLVDGDRYVLRYDRSRGSVSASSSFFIIRFE